MTGFWYRTSSLDRVSIGNAGAKYLKRGYYPRKYAGYWNWLRNSGHCRLGIQKVRGVDIETEAVLQVEQNIGLNGLSGRIKAMIGQPCLLRKPAPFVISNMLLNELLDVHHDLVRLTSPGDTLICSGLLGKQADELSSSVMQLGFENCLTLELENWRAVQFKSV